MNYILYKFFLLILNHLPPLQLSFLIIFEYYRLGNLANTQKNNSVICNIIPLKLNACLNL